MLSRVTSSLLTIKSRLAKANVGLIAVTGHNQVKASQSVAKIDSATQTPHQWEVGKAVP